MLPGGVVVDVNVFLFLLGLVGQRLHFLFDSSAFWQLSQHLQPPTRVLLHRRPKNVAINFVHCKRRRQRIVYKQYAAAGACSARNLSRHFWAAYGFCCFFYIFTILSRARAQLSTMDTTAQWSCHTTKQASSLYPI